MLNFKDIAKIFEEIELRLIASLKRNLMRHKAEEIREDRQWTAWQAIKLQNLQKFRRENRQIMQEYSDKIDADTRQLMTEQFREGEREAEAVAGAEPVASVPDVHFFGVNTPKMERLMQDVVQVEQTAETAALRTMDDVYRRTVNRAQLAMAAGETTLTKAIDMAVREFLERGLNSIVYRDGRHVDYVRMVLRTTSTRAQLQGKSKRFAELGYDTVLISQYGGCSETCEPWQGRAYIDDVFTIWSGEINGDSGKSRYCGKWFPLLSSAIRGGLFHPNCRHTMSLYIDGVTKIPPPIPAEQMQRQRELEQKQRVMERKIRKLKRLEAGTQDPQAVKEYGRKAREAQQELKAFVDEHRDVLKRDYEREKYYGSEVTEQNTHSIKSKKRSLDLSVNIDYVSGSKPITEQLQRELSNEYDKFTEVFGKLDNVRTVIAAPYQKNGVWGSYNDNSNELFLFGIGGDNGKNIMTKIAKDMYKAGNWSTCSPYHAYRHELGHAWQNQLSKSDPLFAYKMELIAKIRNEVNEQINSNLTDASEAAIIKLRKNKLSDYGLDPDNDIDEFVSESIAEYCSGSLRETSRKVVDILLAKEL